MNYLAFQTVVLYAVLYVGQGNFIIQPKNLNVSMNHTLQQLLLEWDVNEDSETNHSELEVVFNIQIFRTEENNVILSENYTTTLHKLNRPLNWSWVSDIPLQCATHGVRLRSKVAFSAAWSNWTPWATVDGLSILNANKSYIFPDKSYAEEDSRVTFCCIAKENETVTRYNFNGRTEYLNTTQRRIMFTEKALPRSKFGLNVYCGFSYRRNESGGDTVLFVRRQLDEPKFLDCETQDMVELKCTWDPGKVDDYCLTEFILSDVSHTNTNCSCRDECKQCLLKISDKVTKYNLTLILKNCVGQKQAEVTFDVASRVKLPPPEQLSVSYLNATMVQLCWNLKPIRRPLLLVCQVNSFSPGGEDEQHNTTMLSGPALRPHINLYGLKVYTNYTLKVRCAVADDLFWKWSDWSQMITIQTNESAPTGQLDIWGSISPGLEERNVTVFWKGSPGFRANGIIKTYHICWENVEQSISCHSLKSNNYTISLDSQPYKITVWANNSASASPASVLHISAAKENGDVNCSEENTANNTAHGIYVSWKATSKFDAYVVDWCNYPKSHPCDFQWLRFGQNESSTLITSGAFIPGVRYTFRVYGTQDNGMYLLEKKAKYLEELEPAQDPSFNISAVTSRWLALSWESYPEDFQPGFIRGYSVYVKMENRNCTLEEFETMILPGNLVVCKHTITDRNKKNLTLRNLEPGTTYLLAVQAYSVNPRNISDKFEAVTTQDERNWFRRLLPPLITVPLMVIICVCFWKTDCVRNCLFPEVPHPYISPIKKTLVITEEREVIPDRLVVIKKTRACIGSNLFWGQTVENMTYFNPNSCPSLQDQEEGTTKKVIPTSTSYKPLQDLMSSRPNTCCPQEMGQGNLLYVSQAQAPPLGVMQSALPHFREP